MHGRVRLYRLYELIVFVFIHVIFSFSVKTFSFYKFCKTFLFLYIFFVLKINIVFVFVSDNDDQNIFVSVLVTLLKYNHSADTATVSANILELILSKPSSFVMWSRYVTCNFGVRYRRQTLLPFSTFC